MTIQRIIVVAAPRTMSLMFVYPIAEVIDKNPNHEP